MVMLDQQFRLVTRSDFDGLVCAVLLRHRNLIDEITFVHPKDMQDGKIEIGSRDITTNLPYVPGAYLVFDHHASETLRNNPESHTNYVIDSSAPSAARVVYDYYGGEKAFPGIGADLMDAVDKADAAQFDLEEVLHPTGWVLLNFLMDARTGLGRFRDFRISNYQLMMELIEACRTMSIDEILTLDDVAERVALYREHEPMFIEQLHRCSEVHGNLVVLDLRNEDIIYAGNRFMLYALYPEANISAHVLWGRERRNVVVAVGKSIFNRSSRTHVGELMLAYEGGGHNNAGTCQLEHEIAPMQLREIIRRICADG